MRAGSMGWMLVAVLAGSGARAVAQTAPSGQPPSSVGMEGPSDEERAKAIEAQLSSDPALRDNRITIEVTGKRVRLSGKVDSVDERRHAEDIVRQSDPTLTVENLLQAADER